MLQLYVLSACNVCLVVEIDVKKMTVKSQIEFYGHGFDSQESHKLIMNVYLECKSLDKSIFQMH